jgi:hypothetical protein
VYPCPLSSCPFPYSKELASTILARALEHAVGSTNETSPFIIEPLIEFALCIVSSHGPSLATSFEQALHLLVCALRLLRATPLSARETPLGRCFSPPVSPTRAPNGIRRLKASMSLDDARGPLPEPLSCTLPPSCSAHARSRSAVQSHGITEEDAGDKSATKFTLDDSNRTRLRARAIAAIATALHNRNWVSEPLRLWRQVLAMQMQAAKDARHVSTVEARVHVCALAVTRLFMLSEAGANELAKVADSPAVAEGSWRTTYGRGRPGRGGIYFQPVVPRDCSKERAHLTVRRPTPSVATAPPQGLFRCIFLLRDVLCMLFSANQCLGASACHAAHSRWHPHPCVLLTSLCMLH